MYDIDMYDDKAPTIDAADVAFRFFLFSGPDYYPGGGMSDFLSAHPTLEAAEDAMTETLKRECWAHIAALDPTEGLVIVKRATKDDDE